MREIIILLCRFWKFRLSDEFYFKGTGRGYCFIFIDLGLSVEECLDFLEERKG